MEDTAAGIREESGWGTPIQRLHLLAHRAFVRGLNEAEIATYAELELDVARACGTTPTAVARLVLQRELARRAEVRSRLAHRPSRAIDHRPVDLLRDLTNPIAEA